MVKVKPLDFFTPSFLSPWFGKDNKLHVWKHKPPCSEAGPEFLLRGLACFSQQHVVPYLFGTRVLTWRQSDRWNYDTYEKYHKTSVLRYDRYAIYNTHHQQYQSSSEAELLFLMQNIHYLPVNFMNY